MRKIVSSIIILLVILGGFYFLSQLFKNEEIERVDFGKQQTESDNTSQEQEPASSSDDQKVEFDKLSAMIMKEGTGEGAKNGDQITAHYVGVLEDGTKFDSSLDRGQPFTFTLGAGQVIQGWELGIVGMKTGEIRRLFIPSALAYGEAGTPGGEIPPNTNLIFEIELLEISQ